MCADSTKYSLPRTAVTYIYGSLESVAVESKCRARGYVTTIEHILGHALGSRSQALALVAVSGLAVTSSITSKASNLGLPRVSDGAEPSLDTTQHVEHPRSRSGSLDSASTVSRPYFDMQDVDDEDSFETGRDKHIDSAEIQSLQKQLEQSLFEISELQKLLNLANGRLEDREAELQRLKHQLEAETVQHSRGMAELNQNSQDRDHEYLANLDEARTSVQELRAELDQVKEQQQVDKAKYADELIHSNRKLEEAVDKFAGEIENLRTTHNKTLAELDQTKNLLDIEKQLHLDLIEQRDAREKNMIKEHENRLETAASELVAAQIHSKELLRDHAAKSEEVAEISQRLEHEISQRRQDSDAAKVQMQKLDTAHAAEMLATQKSLQMTKSELAESQQILHSLEMQIQKSTEAQRNLTITLEEQLATAKNESAATAQNLAHQTHDYEQKLAKALAAQAGGAQDLARSQQCLKDLSEEHAAQKEKWQIELRALQEERDQHKRDLHDQTRHLQDVAAEHQRLSEEEKLSTKAAKEKVATLEERLEIHGKRTDDLQSSLNKINEQFAINKLQADKALILQKEQFEAQKAEYESQRIVLRKDIETKNDELSVISSRLKMTIERFEESQRQIQLKTQEVDSFKADNARLKKESQTMLEENQTMLEENEKHIQALRLDSEQAIEVQNSRHKKLVHESQVVSEQLRADLAVLSAEFSQLKNQSMMTQSHQSQQLQRLQVQTEAKVLDLQEQHLQRLKEKDLEIQQVKSLHDAELRDSEESHESEIGFMKSNLTKTLIEVEQLQSRHKDVLQSKSDLEKNLTTLQARHEMVTSDFATYKKSRETEIDKLQRDITEQSNTIISMKTEAEKASLVSAIKPGKQQLGFEAGGPGSNEASIGTKEVIDHKELGQEEQNSTSLNTIESLATLQHARRLGLPLSDAEMEDGQASSASTLIDPPNVLTSGIAGSASPTSRNFSRRQPSIGQSPQPPFELTAVTISDSNVQDSFHDRQPSQTSLSLRSPPRRRSNSSAAKVHAITGDTAASDCVSTGSLSGPPSPIIPQMPAAPKEKGFRGLIRRTSGRLKRQSMKSQLAD